MTVKILAFLLFSRRIHLSAFDQERHLVSWMRIKFSDVGTGHYHWYVRSDQVRVCNVHIQSNWYRGLP